MPSLLLESGGPFLLANGLGPIALEGGLAPLTIVTASPLVGGAVGSPYSQQMIATGGTGISRTWSITSGTLPAGLTFSSGGLFSGTPTGSTSVTLTIKVIDSSLTSASGTFSLSISGSALSITSTSPLPNGVVGVPYSFTFVAAGGSGIGRVWSITSGSFPAGLSMSAAGVVSGTPTTPISAENVTVQVNDSLGVPASAAFTTTISASGTGPGQVTALQILFQGMNSSLSGGNTGNPIPQNPNTQAIGWVQGSVGSFAITHNKIYRNVDGAGYVLYQTIAAATSYIDTAATGCLNPGPTGAPHNAQGQSWPAAHGYLYKVSAVDSNGTEGPQSDPQIFVYYKNGVKYGMGGDFNSQMTSTYNDTTQIAGNPFGSTQDLLNVTGTGGGQWLPWAGNNATCYNIWVGAGTPQQVFNYLNLTIKPVTSAGQAFNVWVEFRQDNNTDPASGTRSLTIPGGAGTTGPNPMVQGQWNTYKIPLGGIMFDNATAIVQGIFYKLGMNDNTNLTGNHWVVDNVFLSVI